MNYRGKCLAAALSLAVFSIVLAACGREGEEAKPGVSVEKPGVPTAKPDKVAKGQTVKPRPKAEVLPVKGKVLEILDTGSFLFVSLDWQGKKVWATVPGVELKIGEVISLDHATMIKRFYSKTLKRTFDELIFANGVVGKPPRPRMMAKANSKDPQTRRSGKLMAGLGSATSPPGPVPAKPVAKPDAKTGH